MIRGNKFDATENDAQHFVTLFTACAAARLGDIHHVTLSRWVREGLITPHRSSAGHALYTTDHVRQIRELARERKAAWRPAKVWTTAGIREREAVKSAPDSAKSQR